MISGLSKTNYTLCYRRIVSSSQVYLGAYQVPALANRAADHWNVNFRLPMHWNVDGDQGLRLQRGHDEALHWLHNNFENDSEVLSICYIFVLSKIGPSSGHSLPRREIIHWRLSIK